MFINDDQIDYFRGSRQPLDKSKESFISKVLANHPAVIIFLLFCLDTHLALVFLGECYDVTHIGGCLE